MYHHPDTKYFVAVNEKGQPYDFRKMIGHLLYKLSVTETYVYEKRNSFTIIVKSKTGSTKT